MSWLHQIDPYWFLVVILAIILIQLFVEALYHRKLYTKIPVRIHVNGTRGKSSVARLIASGLRGGGIRTCAKTTGTLASFIDPDGEEELIFRVGHTNIIEQLRILRKTARYRAEALVIECMAVQPLLQSLCELKLVRSTHGVLTNARPDHLDVMGPKEEDVAMALAGTMPVNGRFFTTERKHLPIFHFAARDRGSEVIAISEEEANATVSDEDLAGFSYAEYKDNVSLALKVCTSLGVSREDALKGMWEGVPDPGVLSIYTITYKGSSVTFANGFAANDPLSTKALWESIIKKYSDANEAIAVVNCRADRRQRTIMMADTMVDWTVPNRCLAIGSGASDFILTMHKKYHDPFPVVDAGQWSIESILDTIVGDQQGRSYLLVGVCNIAGIGFEILDYFRENQEDQQ